MYILAECDIPNVVTGILSQVYKIILVLVPIGIVVFGSIAFIKAIAAKDVNAIAASTKTFISRLIAGGITFFVLVIVTWLFRIVLSSLDDTNSAMNCALLVLGGTNTSSSNGSSNNSIVDKMNCYGTQFANCMSSNTSPNKNEQCNESANSICGTNNNIPKTTTTTNGNTQSCEECKNTNKENINVCINQDKTYDLSYNECHSKYQSSGYDKGNYNSEYFVDAAALYADCVAERGNNDMNSPNCKTEFNNYKNIIDKYDLKIGYYNLPKVVYDKHIDQESGFGYAKKFDALKYDEKCMTYAKEQEKTKNENYCIKLWCDMCTN